MLRSLLLVLPVMATTLLAQTPICTIQGSGAASPLDGQVVTTTGTVTAVYQGSGTLQGYFIEDPTCDANVTTSNGIFVYQTSAPSVAVGQRIQVTGTVDEFQGLTEIRNVSDVQQLGSGTVPPTTMTLPIPDAAQWERYEGMLLSFPQTLVVNGTGSWLQYGELLLGPDRAQQPTDEVDPNDAVATNNSTTGSSNAAAVLAKADLNERGRIILDDGRTFSYPDPPPFFGPEGTLRTGSTIEGLTAVLTYAFDAYRLQPVGVVPLVHAVRPPVPVVGGTVRVASLNVLNYFTTLGDWGAANSGELERQRTKIVAALTALNADVLVLCELQNNDVAWVDLLNALNAAVGAGTYEGAEVDAFGSGGTKMVLFHRTDRVTPITPLFALNTSTFQRPHLTQGFQVNATGGRLLVSSMHLRSKLCDNATGDNVDQGDGQGCFNGQRRSQAEELVAHWAEVRANTGIDAQVIMGDFNAHTQEDPLDVLRADGLQRLFADDAYSYGFAGAFGALDHAFGTPVLAQAVSAAAIWHINSDEPSALSYSDANIDRYQPNAYRCSDHDALLVGINASELSVGVRELAPDQVVRVEVDANTRHVRWAAADQLVMAVELMDVQGRPLWQRAPATSPQADLSNLPSGVYLWRCVLANGITARGALALP